MTSDHYGNTENLRRLADQLRTPLGVIPFVGAGLSVPMGFPGWTAFLLKQGHRAQCEDAIRALLAAGNYEDAAEFLAERLANRAFEDALDEAFGKQVLGNVPPRGAVTLLPRLASGAVVTTNFDHLLEDCYERAGMPFEVSVWGARYSMATKALLENRRFLLKIHGDVLDPQDRVLTRTQYDRYYGPVDEDGDYPLRRLLTQIWQSRSVLFVGCSLSSDRTMHQLKRVARAMPDLPHYAILEAPADVGALTERERFLSERCVRPIWYAPGKHEAVEQILEDLLRRTRPSRPDTAIRVPSTASIPASPNSEIDRHRPNKIKVFLSQSWTDSVRAALRDQLMAEGYDVDNGSEDPDREVLSRPAVNRLAESHLLVTLLTRDSLQSPAVREELIRAHCQQTKISSIVERSAITILPWHVRASLDFDSASGEELLDLLPRLVSKLKTENLSDYELVGLARSQMTSVYRIWKREPSGSSVRDWQLALSRQIIENAAQEIESLNTHQFSSIVGRGHNFMMRAKPVFECAERVTAVSLDSVSQFWVSNDRADQRIARSYWNAQPPSTRRLFVFSTPESAHNHATILNIHGRKYGKTPGRVYLCSLAAYEEFVRSTGAPPGHRDFAILEYSSQAGPVTYIARLDDEKFEVLKEPTHSLVRQMEEFKDGMARLAPLAPGEIDTETRIMRWRVDLQNDPQVWAGQLRKLFGERSPDVFHMVFIARKALQTADVKDRLRAIVREIRDTLLDLQEKHHHKIRLKDFWIGDSHQVPAHDAQTDGRISNDDASNYPFMLMMRFEDEDGLKFWYTEKTHSRLRRKIYELIDERLRDLFTKSDITPLKSRTIYEEIERIASQHLSRRDYLEADTIEDIVRRRPFRPPVPFEAGG